MADTKITALTAITTVDPAVDVLPIVDVSDTTMAASGTTKKITSNQILGAGGTATLASATITGDLTVDTSTLKVDSANNRVGIGTATPSNLLHVQGSGDIARFTNGTYNAYFAIDSSGYTLFTGAVQTGNGIYAKASTNAVQLWTNGAQRYDIDSTGISTWSVGGSTAMTLNSTGLGVGGSPNAKLTVYGGGATTSTVNFSGNSAGTDNATIASNYSLNFQVDANNTIGGRAFVWRYGGKGYNDGTHLMTLDASGNLLVGTTSQASNEKFSVNTGNTTGAVFKNTGEATYSPLYVWNATTTGDGYFSAFFTEASATLRGSISYNRAGGLVAYNTTSDYRAKDIIGPVSDSGSLIDSLKVYVGKMKGATIERPMLIAHEAQAVAPYAVTGTKDEVDADGNPKYQQMDASSLVPLLIAEIQSLRARVQTLEAK